MSEKIKFVGMRRIRNERKMSAEKLAELVGCSAQMIYLMERGEVNPSMELTNKIATDLGVKIDDLINY